MAPAPEITLHQFPVSHFCEKTRWHLDRAGLPYAINNVVPGAHRYLLKRRTVPVLADGDTTLGDSTEIALHIEKRYGPTLLPEDAAARARVLELVRFFDTHAGPSVRDFMYAHLLLRFGAARALVLEAYPLPVRALGFVLTPMFERGLAKTYRIKPATADTARRGVVDVVEKLEAELGGRTDRYLVGDRLSLADVTAAALLAPLVAAQGSPWRDRDDDPEAIRVLRDEVRGRVAGRWVAERYRLDRAATRG